MNMTGRLHIYAIVLAVAVVACSMGGGTAFDSGTRDDRLRLFDSILIETLARAGTPSPT